MKGFFILPQTPKLEIAISHIRTLIGEVLPLCKDAVGVFYSPADWATGHLLGGSYPSAIGVFYSLNWLDHRSLFRGGSYPSAEMQSVYFTASIDLTTGHSLGQGVTPLQRCNRCILQPQLTWPQGTRWGSVSPLCRDAIGVFSSPNRLDHRALVGAGSHTSAEIKSVYSIAPADRATGNSLKEGFTLLQRCNQCILHPQPNGLTNIWIIHTTTKKKSEISHQKTWTRLRKGNLKKVNESLRIAEQNNATRISYVKPKIDKTQRK